jgi:hypothetical protein
LLFVPPAFSQTADREFKIEAAALVASNLADTVSTAQAFHRCSTCIEANRWYGGDRNMTKISLSSLAIDLGVASLSYEWKRHIHNRWLHPLWRAGLILQTESHTQAAIHNWRTKWP